MIAGGIALGIMMIPIMARTTEELLRLVPMSLREGALALGATRARAVFSVVLPGAFPASSPASCSRWPDCRRDGPAALHIVQ